MKKLYLVWLFVLVPLAVLAPERAHALNQIYHFSNCGTGSVGGCVNGSDANGPTCSQAAPCQTITYAGTLRRAGGPGDVIKFAKGGAWDGASAFGFQQVTGCMPATNCTLNRAGLDSYQPSWYGGAQAPRLNETGLGTNSVLDYSGSGADGGYFVRNIDVRGGSHGNTTGIGLGQSVSVVEITNVNVEGFGIGVYCGGDISYVQFRNGSIKDNDNQGLLNYCLNSTFEGTVYDGNGNRSNPGTHQVYFACDQGAPCSNLVFRNNTLINSSLVGGICGAAIIAGHGEINGLTIEGNTITQAQGTANPGCWAIAIDASGDPTFEAYRRLIIRGNSINGAIVAIQLSSAIAPLVENNSITVDTTGLTSHDFYGIWISRIGSNPGQEACDTGSIIRNNTFDLKLAGSFDKAIFYDSRPADGCTSGTNLQMVDNVVNIRSAATANYACWDFGDRVLANFTSVSNNVCKLASPAGSINAAGADFSTNLLTTDPQISPAPAAVNGYAVPILSTSPARNSGNTTYGAPLDQQLCVKLQPDRGARGYYPSGCTPVPQPQTIYHP